MIATHVLLNIYSTLTITCFRHYFEVIYRPDEICRIHSEIQAIHYETNISNAMTPRGGEDIQRIILTSTNQPDIQMIEVNAGGTQEPVFEVQELSLLVISSISTSPMPSVRLGLYGVSSGNYF